MLQRLVTAIGVVLVATAPAYGVDGVLEINQTCAVNTGCFTGDAPAFPVHINTPGASVRLTSNLTVPTENTTAISVLARDVSVDLNGFVIQGPTVCSGFPPSCAPLGGGSGVASGANATTVSNGTIRGMGAFGVLLNHHGRVEGIRASGNGGTGIRAFFRGLVTGCVVTDNRETGIFGDEGVFRDNVVAGNGGFGIDSFGSTVIGNTIRGNTNVGINAGSATAYGNNQISANNGGDANPQVAGSSFEIAPNVCGSDLTCP